MTPIYETNKQTGFLSALHELEKHKKKEIKLKTWQSFVSELGENDDTKKRELRGINDD